MLKHSLPLRRSLLISVSISLLAGCALVGPDYQRPKSEISANWIEAADQRVSTNPTDFRHWWKIFRDPVLDRLMDRAYRENLNLKIAATRILEARANLGIAIAGLYPQTQQASGYYQYNHLSAQSQQASFGVNLNYQEVQVGLSAAWEIDFWGKYRRAIQSADAAWRATVDDYDNALVSLTADVANAYISIRTLEKRIALARENVAVQEESFNIALARFQYGTTTQLDVEQAATLLNNTRASIPLLETQLQQGRNALSLLLGLPPGPIQEILQGTGGIPAPPPQVALGLPVELLRRRPDVRSAEHKAVAQSAQIGVAKADLYPSFSLAGMFGFLSTDVGNSSLTDLFSGKTYQFGPSFQWNLFNYGRIKSNIRVQDARLQQLLIAYQSTVIQAQQEVENALVAFLKAQDRAFFLENSTGAADRALTLALRQYQAGARDFTTVISAQQALLSEQDSRAANLGALASNLVGIYRALGGGWEIREGRDIIPPEVREAMAQRTDWGNLLEPIAVAPPEPPPNPKGYRPPDW